MPSREPPAAGPVRPRRGVCLRRGGDAGAGRVRQGQQRYGHEHELDGRGQVRRGAVVQRLLELGDHPRRALTRPDHRHDPGGVGQPGRARPGLAHGDLQGAAGRDGLQPLRPRRGAPTRAAVPRRRAGRARQHRAAAECLDAPGRDLRRLDAAPLRQRRPGRQQNSVEAPCPPQRGATDPAATRSGANTSAA